MKPNRNSSNTTKKRKKVTTQEPKFHLTTISQNQTNTNTINQILILDNGGYTIKHLTLLPNNNNKSKYKTTPNCTATLPHQVTILVGDEIEKIQNKSQCIIQYPLERGYVTDLGAQLRVWNRILTTCTSNDNCAVFLLTQPFTPKVISTNIDYTFYKDLSISKLSKRLGACIASSYYIKNTNNKCCLVVDSGFSMTHVIPTYNGYALKQGIKRINVGGKVLTNALKQFISYRQWNMMDDFYIVNEIKEKCCFVMNSEEEFRNAMKMKDKQKHQSLMQRFVLPDFVTTFEGYVKQTNEEMNQNNQMVTIATERYTIPELLFHPSDVGIQQMGLSHTIAQSISLVDIQYQPSLWANILVIGGNANFNGLKERLEQELRSLAPDWIEEVNVVIPDDPIGYTVMAAEEMVNEDFGGFVRDYCLDVGVWEEERIKKNEEGYSCEDEIWEKFYYNSEVDEDMVLI